MFLNRPSRPASICTFFLFFIRYCKGTIDQESLVTMRWDSVLSYGALAGAALALECSPASIQSVLPSNASVNFAYPVPENSTFQVPKGDTGYPTNPVGLPALCAVSVQVNSIGSSTFGFGLFLPDNWNGRFLAVGNGGFAGGVNWVDMVREFRIRAAGIH
jgi:feruloyl esterase